MKKLIESEIELLHRVINIVEGYSHTETLVKLRRMLKDRQFLLKKGKKCECLLCYLGEIDHISHSKKRERCKCLLCV